MSWFANVILDLVVPRLVVPPSIDPLSSNVPYNAKDGWQFYQGKRPYKTPSCSQKEETSCDEKKETSLNGKGKIPHFKKETLNGEKNHEPFCHNHSNAQCHSRESKMCNDPIENDNTKILSDGSNRINDIETQSDLAKRISVSESQTYIENNSNPSINVESSGMFSNHQSSIDKFEERISKPQVCIEVISKHQSYTDNSAETFFKPKTVIESFSKHHSSVNTMFDNQVSKPQTSDEAIPKISDVDKLGTTFPKHSSSTISKPSTGDTSDGTCSKTVILDKSDETISIPSISEKSDEIIFIPSISDKSDETISIPCIGDKTVETIIKHQILNDDITDSQAKPEIFIEKISRPPTGNKSSEREFKLEKTTPRFKISDKSLESVSNDKFNESTSEPEILDDISAHIISVSHASDKSLNMQCTFSNYFKMSNEHERPESLPLFSSAEGANSMFFTGTTNTEIQTSTQLAKLIPKVCFSCNENAVMSLPCNHKVFCKKHLIKYIELAIKYSLPSYCPETGCSEEIINCG